MKRRLWIGIPILAAILAMGVGIACSKNKETAAGATNMTGSWIVDASKSDARPGMRGARGEGRWGGPGDGRRPEDGSGRRGRFGRLPRQIHIQQTGSTLAIADSANVPLEQIEGTWNHGRLEVVRQGPRGKVTQSFGLEENGTLLVIRTKMDPRPDRPAREMKRVYRRTAT